MMQSSRSYIFYVLFSLLFLYQAAHAGPPSRWVLSNGDNQICLRNDLINCTCVDLEKKCDRSRQDDGNDADVSKSSSSSSSGRKIVLSEKTCSSEDEIEDCCISRIYCISKPSIYVLVNNRCSKCVPIPAVTNEDFSDTATDTLITRMATTTEQEAVTSVVMARPESLVAMTTETVITEVTTTNAMTTEATTAVEATTTVEMTTAPQVIAQAMEGDNLFDTKFKEITVQGHTTSPGGLDNANSDAEDNAIPSGNGKSVSSGDEESDSSSNTKERKETQSDSGDSSGKKHGSKHSSSSGDEETDSTSDVTIAETTTMGVQTTEATTTTTEDATTATTMEATTPPDPDIVVDIAQGMVAETVIESKVKATENRHRASGDGSIDSGSTKSKSTDATDSSDTTVRNITVSNDNYEDSNSRENGETYSSTQSDTTNSDDVNRSVCNLQRSSLRCPTVSRLLARGCIQGCILEQDDGCPACNCTCLDLVDEVMPVTRTTCNCTENQLCLRVGRFGKSKCVDLLSEGERCDGRSGDERNDDRSGDGDSTTSKSEDESSTSNSSRRQSAEDRRVGTTIGCKAGLICTSVSSDRSECRPKNPNGPCVAANQGGVEFDCAPDGSFRPLQCQTGVENLLRCICVDPRDGKLIVGTSVTVTRRDDAPNCDRLVGCTIQRRGNNITVPHGGYFVDISGCQRCLCSNGEATRCEPAPLCVTASQKSPEACLYKGQNYRSGERFQTDCNSCGCHNGAIYCTHLECVENEVADRCQECTNEPENQVCGINGMTYSSPCAAMHCAGLAPTEYVSESCTSMDVCKLYPCKEGEKCFRQSGTICFSANGCDPDDLRICVNADSLACRDEAILENHGVQTSLQDGDDSSLVCGTNGITYSSLCRLIQDTGNEVVAYAGQCGREECQGGPVCGTDGETYENMCALKTWSANARVDFYGECIDKPGNSRDEICLWVDQQGRCLYNNSNCRHLIKPEEGCCAVCGGIVTIALDLTGLRDYIRISYSARTLNAFTEILAESGFIKKTISERCEVESTLTRSGDVQLSLSAKVVEDSNFCNDASKRIAAAINDPSSVSDSLKPEVLQFATAAVAAPTATAIINEVNTDMDEVSRSMHAMISPCVLLLLIVFVFIFC